MQREKEQGGKEHRMEEYGGKERILAEVFQCRQNSHSAIKRTTNYGVGFFVGSKTRNAAMLF